MAFRWRAHYGSTLNAGLVAAIFQGIRTCIARKPNIFCDLQGGPDPLPPPSGSTHVASFCSWKGWFESRFVRNPEDWFCHLEAQMTKYKKQEIYQGNMENYKACFNPFLSDMNPSWKSGWDRKFWPKDHRLASRGFLSDNKGWKFSRRQQQKSQPAEFIVCMVIIYSVGLQIWSFILQCTWLTGCKLFVIILLKKVYLLCLALISDTKPCISGVMWKIEGSTGE